MRVSASWRAASVAALLTASSTAAAEALLASTRLSVPRIPAVTSSRTVIGSTDPHLPADSSAALDCWKTRDPSLSAASERPFRRNGVRHGLVDQGDERVEPAIQELRQFAAAFHDPVMNRGDKL